MVPSIAITVSIALTLLMIVHGCCGQFMTSKAYLDLPTEAIQFKETFHTSIREALLKVIPEEQFKYNVADVLKKAIEDSNASDKDRELYKAILSIYDDDEHCSPLLIKAYLSIGAQSSYEYKLNDFYKFIRDNGGDKFKDCARHEIEQFEKSPEEPEAVGEFREFYVRLFDLQPAVASDGDLYEKLISYSNIFSQFNRVKMIKAAVRDDYDRRDKLDEHEDESYLNDFMARKCDQLTEERLSTLLDNVSLARGYSKIDLGEYGKKLPIIAEYRRLCLAWRRFLSEEAKSKARAQERARQRAEQGARNGEMKQPSLWKYLHDLFRRQQLTSVNSIKVPRLN